MGKMVYIFGLLFIASITSPTAAEQFQKKGGQNSRLILEYNWPEPSKSLNRLPHPLSCNHFVHTKHDGSQVVKRCHGDKMFDYRSLRCENKHVAKCWMNIVKKGNMKKIKRHFSCPYPWGLYPDKEDCTLFYDCMGGKVYPRKCPDFTLFDIVEGICVHSSKALCAQDSDIKTSDRAASQSRVATTIAFKSSGTFDIHSKESSSKDKNSSEGVESDAVQNSIKYKNKFTIFKPTFILTSTMNRKSFRTTDADSEENSSEEVNQIGRTKSKNKSTTLISSFMSASTANRKSFKTTDDTSEENSSEEVGQIGRTKSKTKSTTSKSSFMSASTANRKSFRTTDDGSEENSSEEIGQIGRTTSKNKSTTSKSPFISASTLNRKSFRTTDADSKEDSSEEENSSEEKENEFSSKYGLKSTIPKSRPSSDSTYNIIPISTDMFTENSRILSSSQGGHSTEIPFEVSTLISTEKKLSSVTTTATPVVGTKDDNISDEGKKASWSTEIIHEELVSSVMPFSHKEIDPTTKIPFTDSSTFLSEMTENIEIGSESVSSSSILCPDFDGYFPHPKNKNQFIACVGGKPRFMKCPENLVYDSNTASCTYDKI